jgi:hypothetical protein
MRDLIGKISMYALDQIKKQVALLQSSEGHKALADPCHCSVRWNYDIPCIHLLYPYSVIPLGCVSQRWHLDEARETPGKKNFRA